MASSISEFAEAANTVNSRISAFSEAANTVTSSISEFAEAVNTVQIVAFLRFQRLQRRQIAASLNPLPHLQTRCSRDGFQTKCSFKAFCASKKSKGLGGGGGGQPRPICKHNARIMCLKKSVRLKIGFANTVLTSCA